MNLAHLKFLEPENDAAALGAVSRVWADSDPATSDHPYLARYHLPADALRLWKTCLIAPLTDTGNQLVGLLIVDADGGHQYWLPTARVGHLNIGPASINAIIAVTTLAEAVALHDISGDRITLVRSQDAAQALHARLTVTKPDGVVRLAGFSLAEVSAAEQPGRLAGNNYIFPPPGKSWADTRIKYGAPFARSWIEDPILVFGGVDAVGPALVRSSGTWVQLAEDVYRRCGGPVMPTAMLRDTRGTGWSRLVWLKDRDGNVQRVRIAERDLLLGPQRALASLIDAGLEIVGPQVMPLYADLLRHSRVTARLRLVPRHGWHESHYVGRNGTIGDSNADLPVHVDCLAAAPAHGADGLECWQREVAALARDNSRLVLALSAGFAGLTSGLFEGQMSFGLHLRGASSVGKSTALAVGASIFGPASREIRSWRSTDAGVEAVATAHHHRLLLLDEIAQIDPRAAAQVGYTLGNGLGKQRANGAGRSTATASWQLVFLSSGEISLGEKIAEWAGAPDMREGQAVRILDVAADAGKGLGLFDVLHGFPSGAALSDHLKAATTRSTGDVATAFLEGVSKDTLAARAALREFQTEFLRTHAPQDGDGITARGMSNFAVLAAAGELAIRLGILPWLPGDAMTQLARSASDWLVGRRDAAPATDLDHAREWLQRNADRFSAWEKVDADVHALGYVRQSPFTFYLRPEGWRELCAGKDAASMQAALLNAGLLRNDPARLPGGGLVRFRIIHGDIMDISTPR